MRTSNRWKGDIVLWAVAALAVFGAAGWLNRALVRVAHERRAASGPAGGKALSAGSPVVIRGTFRGRAFLASEEAWDDLLDAENAGSMALIARLVRRGDAVSVEDGARGIVVKTGATSCLVEVQSGPSSGREGWIQREYLREGSR